jgi:hypothetical protein
MEGKGLRSLAALFASAAGVALYIGVFNLHMPWLIIPLAAVAVVGVLLLVVGHLLMGRYPVLAVWLINALPLASFVVAIFVTFGAARAGVVVRQHLDHLPKAENDTLTEIIASVIAGAVGFLTLNGLADGASWVWPRRHVQAAFERCFTRRWAAGSAAAQAIWEDYVSGAKPPIQDWGLKARSRRASVISAARTDGTPPFKPVTGSMTQQAANSDATTSQTSPPGARRSRSLRRISRPWQRGTRGRACPGRSSRPRRCR